ncbi:MAG TPA: hypothetical protein VLM37_08570 [Fibrobacteraceae bacterium]|nr:hypothetical protein [Fibrobacteraceae bacterium]
MRSLRPMLLLLCLISTTFATDTLLVSTHLEEKSNWSWNAVAQMVLDHYGVYLSQTEIAAWATPYEHNAPVFADSDVTYIPRYSTSSTINHFTGATTEWLGRALTLAEVQSLISQGYMIVTLRNSGTELIYGYSDSILYTVCPIPGYGRILESYTDYLDSGTSERWKGSLVMTSLPTGTRPSRPIPEDHINKTYTISAFDKLKANDRVECYAKPTGTGFYGRLGSGWQFNCWTNPSSTYGVTVGASSLVGSVFTTGPVLMRSNSTINGVLKMKDTTKLTQQTGATITGNLYQETIDNNSFGWGTIDFGSISHTTVYIEPDQARTYLSPGKYWSYTLKARSPVRLQAGDYFFHNFICDACSLEVDASSGPVRIYVANTMIWTGTLAYISGDPTDVMVGYLGPDDLYINGTLNATIIAPNSLLVIGQTTHDFTGMFIGRNLTVHQETVVRYSPFSFDD